MYNRGFIGVTSTEIKFTIFNRRRFSGFGNSVLFENSAFLETVPFWKPSFLEIVFFLETGKQCSF
jgi:hypothetical protein